MIFEGSKAILSHRSEICDDEPDFILMSISFIPNRFKDKVLIITGATSGIGRAAAIRAGLEGGKIVVVGRNAERGAEVVNIIREHKSEAIFVLADVSKPDDVKRMFEKTMEMFKSLDILINNAGVLQSEMIPVDELDFNEFKRICDTNIYSTFLCTQEAAHIFRAQGTGGSIVNVGSVTGITGFKNASAYVTSKHAVSGLTKASAFDLADANVRVNAVCPHTTETPMVSGADFGKIAIETGKSIQEILYDKIGQKVQNLQGRAAKPDEQASTILFFASDESRHITGSIIASDNGFTCF